MPLRCLIARARKEHKHPSGPERSTATQHDRPPSDENNRLELDQRKIGIHDVRNKHNAKVFFFCNEDYKLGDLLSQRLIRYEYMRLAHYKIFDISNDTVSLEVETDGSVLPTAAVL